MTLRFAPWHAALAGTLLLAAGTVAYGQGDLADSQLSSFQLQDETVLVVSPTGQVVRRPVGGTRMEEMVMKGATPVAAGTILVMRGGRLYATQDHPMANGRMLSNMLMHAPR